MMLLDTLKLITGVKIVALTISKIKMLNETFNPREHKTRWNEENLIIAVADGKGEEKMKKSERGFQRQERKSRESTHETVYS